MSEMEQNETQNQSNAEIAQTTDASNNTLSPAEMQAQFVEMQKALHKANEEAKNYRLKAKELQEQTMIEQGKYKELYESLKNEVDKTKTEYSEVSTKYLQLLEQRKADLLEQLPTAIRGNYKDFPIEVIQQIAKDFPKITPSSVHAERGATAGNVTKSFGEMTSEEKTQLYNSNPSAFYKLSADYIKAQFKGA